jgi:ADP-ribosylglycohydrolase
MAKGIRKNQYSTDGVLVRSIIGGIIGDIAGSTREGYGSNTPFPISILTASSYFTDDSALTIAVADWLNNKDTTDLKTCLLKWSHL